MDTGGTLYTVPSGNALILKSFLVRPKAAGNWYLTAVLQAGAIQVVLFSYSGVPAANVDWSGWTVLNAGDQLHLSVNFIAVDYWVAGAVLPFESGALPPLVQTAPAPTWSTAVVDGAPTPQAPPS